MAGIKVSDLSVASGIAETDLLYLVNSGNPRKATLLQMLTYLLSKKVVTSINGVDGDGNGVVNLTPANLGLGNVTNALGAVSVNGVEGVLNITASTGITVTGDNAAKTVHVDATALELPFSQITGDPVADNPALAAALASVGVQLVTRLINAGTGSLDLTIQDIQRPWVDVDFTTPTSVRIPNAVNAPVGAVIEVRQEGTGVVTIVGDSIQIVNQRPGVRYTTEGRGTRIQVVSLGTQAWEYR